MKKIKIVLLLITIAFSSNVFSQTGDMDGDGVLDKNDLCPQEKGTIKNKGCPDQIAKPIKKEAFNLDDNFTLILDDAKYDFDYLLGEKTLEKGTMQHFNYKKTLGGTDEKVVKTFNADSTINTIYFKSTFYLKTVEEVEYAKLLQLSFLLFCTNYELDKDYKETKEVDALQNKKTILKDKLGNICMLLVEKPNDAGITLFIYGKSASKKMGI
jgi:hypothetical protein